MLLSLTPEVSIGDILQGGAIFLSIIASATAFWISRQRDLRLREAEYVTKLWNMWTEEMDDAWDLIDNESFSADDYWKKDDGKLYTYLFFLEFICQMRRARVISEDQLSLYAYEIVVVHSKKEVANYIGKLDEELSRNECRVKMFAQSRAIYGNLTGKRDPATGMAK